MSMSRRIVGGVAMAVNLASAAVLAQTGSHQHGSHAGHSASGASAAGDTRQLVKFPESLRVHTLANMRDHLQVLGELQRLLATGAFDKAADLAESRLGMSSLGSHGAHEVAKYMPKGMQDAGTAMHRSASQFARIATDASVTGDLKDPLNALSTVSQTCVVCHAAYRLQ
jgi:hypothetical protein